MRIPAASPIRIILRVRLPSRMWTLRIEPSSQLRERHDASELDLNTQDNATAQF